MKLYQTVYFDDETNTDASIWSGTRAEHRAHEKRLKAEFMRDIRTVAVEVPTNKPNLLEFLNLRARLA